MAVETAEAPLIVIEEVNLNETLEEEINQELKIIDKIKVNAILRINQEIEDVKISSNFTIKE